MTRRTASVLRRSVLLGALLLASLGATESRAATVYLKPVPDTDPCSPPSAPPPLAIPFDSDGQFYLCVDNGSGTGDELYAFDVSLLATGSLEFADFFPEDGVVARHDEKLIRANALPDPPALGAVNVGRVVLASTDFGGTIEAMGQQVGAADRLEVIPNTIVALPEPDRILLLASGLALLAGLQSLRSRAARRSQPAADQQER